MGMGLDRFKKGYNHKSFFSMLSPPHLSLCLINYATVHAASNCVRPSTPLESITINVPLSRVLLDILSKFLQQGSIRIRRKVRFRLPVHDEVKLAICLLRESGANHSQLVFSELTAW
jgi:hypothetical protein